MSALAFLAGMGHVLRLIFGPVLARRAADKQATTTRGGAHGARF